MNHSTTKRSALLNGLLAVGLLSLSVSTSAAAFPERPIKIVVNTGPGGLVDVSTRLVADKMSEHLGQSVIVENRPGGGGGIAARAVRTSRADGYTLLSTAGTIAIQPAVRNDPGYEITDFTGIGPTLRTPVLMVTSGTGPHKSIKDFISSAQSQSGKMTYASAGIGSTTHIGAASFLKEAGLNLLHVPYNGNGPAMPDVMSGRVDMIFEAYGSGAPKVEAGTLRALAITSTSRLPRLPDVPTLAESGVPDFSYYLWLGILAPAGTPEPVVERLSEALRHALSSPDLQQRFEEEGAEVMTMSSKDFTEFVRDEEKRMAKVVSDLGIEKQ